MSRIIAVAAMALAMMSMAGAMLAAPVGDAFRLRCEMGTETRNWIRPTIFVGRNAGDKSVVVSDSLILIKSNKPIRAKIVRENGTLLVVEWQLKDLVDAVGAKTPEFRYRARLQKADGRIKVSARPVGYPNSFHKWGTCTPAKR